MTAQSVILPMPSEHARFVVLRLKHLSINELKEQLNHFLSIKDVLTTQHRDANIKTGIAFGRNLWQKLYPQTPNHWHELVAIDGDFKMPAVPADIFLHIASTRADLCFALSQAFFAGIQDKVDVLDERACFRYLDRRDLTGFIDGTENPQSDDDRKNTALLDDTHGDFTDGSFVFAQRYVHDLEKWQHLKVDDQEQVIGRTKLESIELDDDIKPQNAHASRTVIEDENGEELAILRHSLPYGDGQGDKGLFFVAYSNDLSIIDRMLQRMFGASDDNIHDQLLHFTTAVDGAYYFAPSEELLDKILESDD